MLVVPGDERHQRHRLAAWRCTAARSTRANPPRTDHLGTSCCGTLRNSDPPRPRGPHRRSSLCEASAAHAPGRRCTPRAGPSRSTSRSVGNVPEPAASIPNTTRYRVVPVEFRGQAAASTTTTPAGGDPRRGLLRVRTLGTSEEMTNLVVRGDGRRTHSGRRLSTSAPVTCAPKIASGDGERPAGHGGGQITSITGRPAQPGSGPARERRTVVGSSASAGVRNGEDPRRCGLRIARPPRLCRRSECVPSEAGRGTDGALVTAGGAARAAQAAGRVDHGRAEWQPGRRVVGGLEHVAAAGQRDPDRELPEDRVALGVQRLHAEHGLTGQDQMDSVRASGPGQPFEQADGLVRHRIGAGQQHRELVDDAQDPWQRLARPSRRPPPHCPKRVTGLSYATDRRPSAVNSRGRRARTPSDSRRPPGVRQPGAVRWVGTNSRRTRPLKSSR